MLLPSSKEREEAKEALKQHPPEVASNVRLRTGNPARMTNLVRVRAGAARTIVYLDPDEEEDQEQLTVQKAAAAMALMAVRISQGARMAQTFVLQIASSISRSNSSLLQQATHAYHSDRTWMVGVSKLEDVLGAMVGVCTLQPSLTGVFSDLLTVNPGTSALVYCVKSLEMEGLTHREVRRRYHNSGIVCGYLHKNAMQRTSGLDDISSSDSMEALMSANDNLILNPPDNYVLKDGDTLLTIAKTASLASSTDGTPATLSSLFPATWEPLSRTPPNNRNDAWLKAPGICEKIVLIACDRLLDTLLDTMAELSPPNGTIDVCVITTSEETR